MIYFPRFVSLLPQAHHGHVTETLKKINEIASAIWAVFVLLGHFRNISEVPFDSPSMIIPNAISVIVEATPSLCHGCQVNVSGEHI
jgi:hypothetical protein